MSPRESQVTDEYDRPVPGAQIYVYDVAGNQATLTSDGTLPLAQPVVADEFGVYRYYADGGVYREDTYHTGKLRYREAAVVIGDGGGIFKGDPGGNVMAIGLFNAASSLTIPVGTDLVQTSGYSAKGKGAARYFHDATVDAAYATANPRTSFVDQAGRGFKLDVSNGVAVTQTGAVADAVYNSTTSKWDGTDDAAAIQAAANATRHVIFPPGIYRIVSSILYDSNHRLVGQSKGGRDGTAKIVTVGNITAFQARTKATDPTYHVTFENLTIDGDTLFGAGTNTIGISLEATSYAVIRQCSFRNHHKGIYGTDPGGLAAAGYYHSITDCEIANCQFGIHGTIFNATRISGGRITSNKTGLLFNQTVGSWVVGAAFERNEIGLHFTGNSSNNYLLCYWEGNGKTRPGDVAITDGTGAAVIFDAGTHSNKVFGSLSNALDRVIDLDGRNPVYARSSAQGGLNPDLNGENLWWNESLDYDSDEDGLVDGLKLSAALPAGMTLTTPTTGMVTGNQYQRMTIAAAGSSARDLRLAKFPTTRGQVYSVAFRVRAGQSSGWYMRGGHSYAGSEYLNSPILTANLWVVMRHTFVATSDYAFFYAYTHPDAVVAKATDVTFDIDSWYAGEGMLVPAFGTITPNEPLPSLLHTGGVPATSSTHGTDTAPVATETYFAAISVPYRTRVTGVRILNGSALAGSVRVAIHRGDGERVTNSGTIAPAGVNAYQDLAVTEVVLLPGTYFIALQSDNAAHRFRSHAFGSFPTGKKTGETFGTHTKLTPPTTFTANVGPIATLL